MEKSELVDLIRMVVKETVEQYHNSCNGADSESLFDEFWKEYPHKVGKVEAKKVWNKIAPSKILFGKILSGLRMQKKTIWSDVDKQYIPHAAKWLRNERWLDEVSQDYKPDAMSSRNPTEEELKIIRDEE